MLRFRTHLLPSPIHGTGVFAAESIPRGATVWQFEPGLDLVLPRSDNWPDDVEEYLRHFAFYDAGRDGLVLCGDNAKWMNHSDSANTRAVFSETAPRVYICDVAVRDIQAGEELTCDYRAFDRGEQAAAPPRGSGR